MSGTPSLNGCDVAVSVAVSVAVVGEDGCSGGVAAEVEMGCDGEGACTVCPRGANDGGGGGGVAGGGGVEGGDEDMGLETARAKKLRKVSGCLGMTSGMGAAGGLVCTQRCGIGVMAGNLATTGDEATSECRIGTNARVIKV